MSEEGCEAVMPTRDVLSQDISKIVQSLGMSDSCRRALSNSNRDNHFEMHADYEANLGPGGLLGSANGSLGMSMSNTDTRNALNAQGCGTALSDLKSIIDERYKIACDINATSVTTDNLVVTKQSIDISINVPRDKLLKLSDDRKEMEANRPVRPPMTSVTEMIIRGVNPVTAERLYKLALDSYDKEMAAFNERIKTFADPSILGQGAIIQNVSNLKLKVVTSVDQSVRSSIKESVKKIAGTLASSEISQQSGLGASNDGLKSLISSNLESKDQDITKAVNEISDSLSVTVNSNQQVQISSNSGAIDLRNARITNNLAIDLLTEKFTKVALDLGKEISSDIIKNAASDTSVSQDLGGLEDVIKEVNEGLANRLSSLTDAQAGWKKAGKQDYIMYLILAGLVMGGGGIGASGKLTPIKIIMLLILLYLVIALLFGWFPFSFFGMKLFGSSNSSDSGDSREELRMNPRAISYKKKANNLYKADPKLASVFDKQSSVKQIVVPRRQFLKTKAPVYSSNKNFPSIGVFGGLAIRSRY